MASSRFGQILIIYLANQQMTTAMSVNISTNETGRCNCSTSETEDDMEEGSDELSLASKIIYGIIIPIMAVVCIIGNILTMVSYAQDRKLRTVHNTYLISLAASDLLVGCVSMPFYAVYTLMSYSWPFGVTFCKVFMSIDFLACLESVFVIMLVSYDRCMLLVQGAAYSAKQTIRAAKIRIFISWMIAFLVYVPAICLWDVIRGYSAVEEGDCDVEFYNEFGFTMATSILEFLLPLIIISSLNIYLYSLILKRSREAPGKKNFHNKIKPDNKSNSVKDKTEGSQGADDKYQAMVKRERKAARSLAILVSVFTVCWMPYTVCTVIIAFCDRCVPDNLYEAFAWILWGNSTLNSFLYAFTNKQFRMNYIRLLRLEKLCYRNTKVSPHMSMSAENQTIT